MKLFGIILTTLGATLLTILLIAQYFGDEIVAEVKKTTESTLIETINPTNPTETIQARQYTIKISNTGGETQMDYCAGGFTNMVEYQGVGNKTLLSAHNSCGGDIILPIAMGDHVVIEGQGTYVVTDIRDTPKNAYIEDVENMNGTILVQTCYYEFNRMKFIALTPLET